MTFDFKQYGEQVASILALDGAGERLMPLIARNCSSEEARTRINGQKLFTDAAEPDAAMAGIWLYFSCVEEAHGVAQDLNTPEGSFWHAILHRQEPDSGNAAYWFRKVGSHPIFKDLSASADEIVALYPQAEFRTGGKWDPFSFIMFCERARQQPASSNEKAALEIQRAEWQLLFDYCARSRT